MSLAPKLPTTLEFWSGRKWPRNPPGFTFLAEAVDRLGAAIFGDEWDIRWMAPQWPVTFGEVHDLPSFGSDGRFQKSTVDQWLRDNHPEVERPPRAPGAGAYIRPYVSEEPDYIKFTLEQWREAKALIDSAIERAREADARAKKVRDAIATAAEAGVLQCTLRKLEGGQLLEMNPTWWSTDNLSRRFQFCAINILSPLKIESISAATEFCHIFIRDEGLARLVADQPFAQRREIAAPPGVEVHLSPYMLVMIEAARRSQIGPSIDRQVPIESLKAEILAIAAEQGLEVSDRDLSAMASLLREPESRKGIKKLLSDARKG